MSRIMKTSKNNGESWIWSQNMSIFLSECILMKEVQDARPEGERATPLGVDCDSH